MKLTDRQQYLLTNADKVTTRKKSPGKYGFFLGKEDCSATIHSLIVKGALIKKEGGVARIQSSLRISSNFTQQ